MVVVVVVWISVYAKPYPWDIITQFSKSYCIRISIFQCTWSLYSQQSSKICSVMYISQLDFRAGEISKLNFEGKLWTLKNDQTNRSGGIHGCISIGTVKMQMLLFNVLKTGYYTKIIMWASCYYVDGHLIN